MEDLITIEEAKNDLLSCAVYLAGKINSNESQAVTIKPIVEQYLEKNDVDNAAALADIVNDSYTRNQLLVAVIAKCVQIDDEEYAFQLVEAIDDYGMQTSANEAIALHKAAKGDFDGALEIAEKLSHSSDAFAGIAVAQAKKGLEDASLETLDKIEFYKSRVEALQEIAIFHLKQEQNQKAINLLEKAYVDSSEIEFTEDKIRAYLETATYFIEAKENEKAILTFKTAIKEIEKLDGVQRENLFANVAIGFLKAGDVDLADSTLDEVIDKTQVSNCLLGFSQVFEKEGDKEEALDSVEESYAILKSQQESEIRNSKLRFQLFASIALQFARLGKIERALEIAHENPDKSQTNIALTSIAQICVLSGNDEMAEQSLKGIETDSQKMSALVAISDAKKQADKKDEAVEYLDEAKTMVDTIPQFISRSETQNEIAERYGVYGKNEKAREIASASLQTIGEILGENNRSIALAELSQVYEKSDFTLSEEDKEVLELLVRKSNW